MFYERLRIFSIMLIVFSFTMISCATSSRGQIGFDDLKYPASLSACLYGPNNEILTKDKDLQVIKKYYFKKISWNLFYGLVSLSDNSDVVKDINREIAETGGDGMVSIEVSSQEGIVNDFYFFNLLPFWPTYSKITIEADIVKYIKK